MIIRGGENVCHSEVEGVLGAHPKVKEVAVIGVPHEKYEPGQPCRNETSVRAKKGLDAA